VLKAGVHALVACCLLSGLLACSKVSVHGRVEIDLYQWPQSDAGQTPVVTAQPRSLIGTAWLAEDIGGRGVIDRAQTTMVFDAEGQVSGSGGCNRYFGPVSIDGTAIAFGSLGATGKACVPALMDQEQKFLGALAMTRSYRFEQPGDKLVFLSEDGTPLIRFTPLE
jgi:heat shock protein HslJ